MFFLETMKLENYTPIVSVDLLDWLVANNFFLNPAAIKHHGNYAGGLFDHSLAVTNKLVELTKNLDLKWQNPRSPYVVGMFHDLCKIDSYTDENASEGTNGIAHISEEPKWVYNKNQLLKGHGDKSIMLLSQFINLTEEEILCIRFHMGAYETDDWDSYDKAIRKYETVLWTHTADMWAAKVVNK
jgi:23S rRNA maturation-related 3'-5' exoribonuclease YhaM